MNYQDTEKYREYLKSDEWKALAKKRMKIDGYSCCMCGCTGTANNPLEVHHLTYKYIYREETRIYQELMTLCHVCHKSIHKAMERITGADGHKGWKDNPRIPQIHAYNINGTIEYEQTGGTENDNH
ncbi:MAG: hypothetical protein K5649_01035 [Lachnospiraceae bacterium]|nr:hypothetical protein [Lachnospiraceae bacterium]